MKKILLLLLTLIVSASIYGQVRPDNFPEDTAPEDTDAFYTQEATGGTPTARKILLSTLRTFYLTDVKNSTLPQWEFDVGTSSGDPGTAIVRYNSPTTPTEIYLSETSQQGADMEDILSLLASGSVVYLQALDGPARFLSFNVTGAVDNGAWWTLTGSVSDIGSAKLDGEDIGMSMYGGGGGGSSTHLLPTDFGITGIAADSLNWVNFMDAHIAQDKIMYIPKGVYQMPEFWIHTVDSLRMVGEDGAIFTTSASRSILMPKRISLVDPIFGSSPNTQKVPDGIYKVDILPSSPESDWAAIAGSVVLYDYVELISGVPSIITVADVIAGGYIPDISNVTGAAEPTDDGLYVVNLMDYNFGGGYAYDEFIHDAALDVIFGSIVELTSGTWTIYEPSEGFNSTGNVYMENIEFDNYAPYCLLPSSTNANKVLYINNVKASNVIRFIGWEQSGQSSGPALTPSHEHKPIAGFADNTIYSFDILTISNSTFRNIHQTVLWGCTPTKNYNIINNKVFDSETLITAFHYMWNDLPDKQNIICNYRDNQFKDLRNYSQGFAVDRVIGRTPENGYVHNNTYKGCNGIQIYVSGGNNVVSDNVMYPFVEWYSGGNHSPILCKANSDSTRSELYHNNTIIGGGKINAFTIVKSINEIHLRDNVFRSGSGIRYVFTETDGLEKEFSYIIRDSVQFKSIVDDYENTIDLGDVFYWDLRNWRWSEKPGSTGDNPIIVWAPSEDAKGIIRLEGGTYEGDYFFQNNTPTFTLDSLIIDGITAVGMIKAWQFEDISHVEIINSDIEIHGSAGGMGMPAKSWSLRDNTFRKSPTGELELFSNGDLHFIGNKVLPILEDRYDDLDLTTATFTHTIEIDAVGDVYIIDNEIDCTTSGNTAFRIEEANSVTIVDNFIKLNIPVSGSSERIVMHIVDDFSGSNIAFEQNTITYDATAIRELFTTTLTGATTIAQVSIANNTYPDRVPTLFINSVSSNLTITNLAVGVEIHDAATTFNTNATITNFKPVRIVEDTDLVLENGFIGINEPAPTSPLHVRYIGPSGSITTSAIRFENDAGADSYMFADNGGFIVRTDNGQTYQFSNATGALLSGAGSGAFLIFNGVSSSLPTYTYFADANTGIGRASADILDIYAGGKRMNLGVDFVNFLDYDSGYTLDTGPITNIVMFNESTGKIEKHDVEDLPQTTTTSWKFTSSTTDSDPGDGNFRLNNADATLATFIFIDDITSQGLDVSNFLGLLSSGDEVIIQETGNPDAIYLYSLSDTVVAASGYSQMAVTFLQELSGGSDAFTNNKLCAFIFQSVGTQASMEVYTSTGTINVNANKVRIETSGTYTLPSVSDWFDKFGFDVLRIKNASGGSVTLDRDGTDVIYDIAAPTATSITLSDGESVYLSFGETGVFDIE